MTDKKKDLTIPTPDDRSPADTGTTVEHSEDKAAQALPGADKNDKKDATPKAPRRPKKRGSIPWLAVISLLLVLGLAAAVAGLAWYGYQLYLQNDSTKSGQVAELQRQLAEQAQVLAQLRQAQANAGRDSQQEVRAMGERLTAAEQRLMAQNKRLLAMSTVTREDWLLAEAEYLLKLANQRILIERSAKGAEALLTEADAILRDLDDPDLFSLRKAVNSDLAALRLIQTIDREGIYLQINGLIDQVQRLPVRPEREQVVGRSQQPVAEKLDQKLTTDSWWAALKHNIYAFGQSLRSYININTNAEKPTPLLAPESAQYLQQNVRLMLERAQLALLREQQAIYQNSLQQAENYLADFYPDSAPVDNFRGQLMQLAAKDIVVELPDITGSLELLHSYIEDLHNLKGAAKPSQGDDGQ